MTETQKKSVKAIGLLSGGLDSTLAVKLLLDQNVDVIAFHMTTPFCTCTRKGCGHTASHIAKQYGISIKNMVAGPEYIEMVKKPKHGYGSNMNPCIDCRIFLFRKAKTYMEEIGAQFIFTGEVLGQRPMSQHRRAMSCIERESDLEGLVLRPLSAKLFSPTIPEENGWVDREKLLAIEGRRRLPQMELAAKVGLEDYACPAGGCRLTDPQFAKRLKDAFDHGEYTLQDIQLLKHGRHVRFPSGAKVVIGRNEEENAILRGFFNPGDIAMEVMGVGSPFLLLKKQNGKEDIKNASTFCLRYSDAKDGDAQMKFIHGDKEELIWFSSL